MNVSRRHATTLMSSLLLLHLLLWTTAAVVVVECHRSSSRHRDAVVYAYETRLAPLGASRRSLPPEGATCEEEGGCDHPEPEPQHVIRIVQKTKEEEKKEKKARVIVKVKKVFVPKLIPVKIPVIKKVPKVVFKEKIKVKTVVKKVPVGQSSLFSRQIPSPAHSLSLSPSLAFSFSQEDQGSRQSACQVHQSQEDQGSR